MTKPNRYDIGDKVLLKVTFKDYDMALTDPTGVTCRVLTPDGDEETPAVERVSQGLYTAEVEPTVAGRWFYRFEGEGALVAAGENLFLVSQSRFPEGS